jgi:cholesterol transport system auxiliary component
MANKLPDRRLVLTSASSLLLTACGGGLGLGPSATDANAIIYMLEPAIPSSSGPSSSGPSSSGAPSSVQFLSGPPVSWALAVDIPDASDALDTRRIALIKADATMDYFANAVWPDRLPLLVQTALVAGFEAGGHTPSVTRTQDALHADYELGTEIRDCAAHYGTPDGAPSVTVSLVAHMVSAHARKIIASFEAKGTQAATQNSTAAAVAAFNSALAGAVGQIVNWALSLPPPG